MHGVVARSVPGCAQLWLQLLGISLESFDTKTSFLHLQQMLQKRVFRKETINTKTHKLTDPCGHSAGSGAMASGMLFRTTPECLAFVQSILYCS